MPSRTSTVPRRVECAYELYRRAGSSDRKSAQEGKNLASLAHAHRSARLDAEDEAEDWPALASCVDLRIQPGLCRVRWGAAVHSRAVLGLHGLVIPPVLKEPFHKDVNFQVAAIS